MPKRKTPPIDQTTPYSLDGAPEKELAESNRRIKDILESIGDAFYSLDHDFRFTYINHKAEELWGKRRKELLGKVIWEVFPQFVGTHSYRKCLRAAHERRAISFETLSPVLGRWIDASIYPTPGGLSIYFRDITERRSAQEALRESEERYRLLFEDSPLSAWVFDSETMRFLAVNDTAVKHYGYSREEFLKMTARDLRTSEEIPPLTEALKAIDRQNGKATYQTRHCKKNGELIDVEITYHRIIFDHRPARFAVVLDITERKKNEERIRQQASLLDHAKDAILVCDLDFQILYWNKGAESLYGWRSEEVLGKEICEVLCGGNDAQRLAAEKALETSDEFKIETRQNAKDGRQITVESRWTLVRSEHEQPDYYLVINTDITDQKKIEEQLLRAQRMESIGTLAGGIAHDLNNILSPILMTAELLELETADDEKRNQLSIIKENAERGADLIRQILVFARGMEGERVAVQLKHIIEDLVNVLKQTFPKSISIKFELEPELWLISADPTQIHQVLMNLSVNARDAMPDGGTLSITAENQLFDENFARINYAAKPGGYVFLTISDTGTGMSEQVQKRIFDPFFTTKETGKGTGLGLSTALSIVQSHSGFINVYSEPGKGSKFSVYLPAMESEASAEAASRSLAYPKGGGELILVVEDEENVRGVTCGTLEKFGYKTLKARDGTEAIAIFAEYRDSISLVLTDIAMPNLDGTTAIRVLQQLKPGVAIVAVSGLASPDKSAQLQSLKVNAFLAKPFTIEKLLSTIADVLKKNQLR